MRRGKEVFESEAADEGMVNLTPLIDVVFVVLIMFIIVAPLMEMESISLAPASTIKNKQAESGGLKIVVDQAGTVRVGGEVIPLHNLKRVLAAYKEKNPGVRPKLFHDSQASFGTYQRVKNAAESAGFEELDVIVKPE